MLRITRFLRTDLTGIRKLARPKKNYLIDRRFNDPKFLQALPKVDIKAVNWQTDGGAVEARISASNMFPDEKELNFAKKYFHKFFSSNGEDVIAFRKNSKKK